MGQRHWFLILGLAILSIVLLMRGQETAQKESQAQVKQADASFEANQRAKQTKHSYVKVKQKFAARSISRPTTVNAEVARAAVMQTSRAKSANFKKFEFMHRSITASMATGECFSVHDNYKRVPSQSINGLPVGCKFAEVKL